MLPSSPSFFFFFFVCVSLSSCMKHALRQERTEFKCRMALTSKRRQQQRKTKMRERGWEDSAFWLDSTRIKYSITTLTQIFTIRFYRILSWYILPLSIFDAKLLTARVVRLWKFLVGLGPKNFPTHQLHRQSFVFFNKLITVSPASFSLPFALHSI